MIREPVRHVKLTVASLWAEERNEADGLRHGLRQPQPRFRQHLRWELWDQGGGRSPPLNPVSAPTGVGCSSVSTLEVVPGMSFLMFLPPCVTRTGQANSSPT